MRAGGRVSAGCHGQSVNWLISEFVDKGDLGGKPNSLQEERHADNRQDQTLDVSSVREGYPVQVVRAVEIGEEPPFGVEAADLVAVDLAGLELLE